MIVPNSWVIRDVDVVCLLQNKKVVIYGIGNDGKEFYQKYKNKLNIVYFIDKSDTDSFFPVYKFDEKKNDLQDKIVIICSIKCDIEIADILINFGYIPGTNFYIWDKRYNEDLEKFVFHNHQIWKANHNENREILIPISSTKDGTELLYEYVGNFLADQEKAEIKAYLRQLGNEFEVKIYPSQYEVYSSFGTKDFITMNDFENEDRISHIFNEIWNNINSWGDVENIEVDGEYIGISLIRDYLRMYELSLEVKNPEMGKCLYYAIKTVLFWKKYFNEHNVSHVILWDGAHNESYLRDIAISQNIQTYIISRYEIEKANVNNNFGNAFPYLKTFYNQLSDDEKKSGLEWAHAICKKILEGNNDVHKIYRGQFNSVFNNEIPQINSTNEKLKVVICPHIFEEDCWSAGHQIIYNNYIAWLNFLGEISQQTDYDWYIKIHPDEKERGNRLINRFVERFTNISLIPANVSPIGLKKMGIRYAFTIYGSIGHEYPLLGIDVVNAGCNPHCSFNFNINPRDINEYRDIIMNLPKYSALSNLGEIYEFYCVYYLYYQSQNYNIELLKVFEDVFENENEMMEPYVKFLDLYSDSFHDRITFGIKDVIDKIDSWTPGIFIKKGKLEIQNILNII